MTALEWRVAGSLALIYAVRMLGLFMILPVFSLYAPQYPHTTDLLVGLAIGIYGLTQAIFQIPLGMLSDRMGRKPVIIGGLLIFAFGSVVAALAQSIEMVILGRALQGMGAIAAVTLALAADLTQEQNRARVMSVIGLTIAMSFAAAMVLGPVISQHYGMAGIFWFTTILALLGIVLILVAVPTPEHIMPHRDAGVIKSYLGTVLANPVLLRLDAGVFTLHMIMTANFLVLPSLFETTLNLPRTSHWQVYLPVFLFAFFSAVPLIIIAEKYQKMRPLLLMAVAFLVVAELGMALGIDHSVWLLLGFVVFFIGFNFLEATQPSLVAKYSNVSLKGTAMSLFSTAQFLGIFVGGVVGGQLKTHYGAQGVFIASAMAAGVWLMLSFGLPAIKFYTSRIIRLDPKQLAKGLEPLQTEMSQVVGVQEIFIDSTTRRAYLKVDDTLDETALNAFSNPDYGTIAH